MRRRGEHGVETPVALVPVALVPVLVALVLAAGTGCASTSGASSAAARAKPSPTPTTVPATTPPTAAPTTAPTSAPATVAAPPTPAPTGIEVGPGPQATYTVEPQPAPGSCRYGYVGSYPLPDPSCTPGATNPQVTQADIGSTICNSGYSASIRPPESVTEPEKEGSAAAYGYTGAFSTAEYDHLIPLELGGDPNDPANLWIEPPDNPDATSTSNTKDLLENELNSLVCSGRMALATAQQAIATDWVSAYQHYGGLAYGGGG